MTATYIRRVQVVAPTIQHNRELVLSSSRNSSTIRRDVSVTDLAMISWAVDIAGGLCLLAHAEMIRCEPVSYVQQKSRDEMRTHMAIETERRMSRLVE